MVHVFEFVASHMKIFELIVFWYPVAMGLLWIVGSVIYYFRIERKDPLPLPDTPMVSILVPTYNESAQIAETVERLNKLDYPCYEIILINDGSKDDTAKIEHSLARKYGKVRVVDLKENCGKANALDLGFMAANSEYLICVDGDSYLDKNCIRYMMAHFLNPRNGERVGAVTGNPRVRNRSSLLASIQLCEYASIISMIKRTQRIWGKVMTVSGVVVAYRKRALLECGLWDRDLITEDIGVTWKLERNFWDVRYEPNALCWMLVPETLKGLYKQRKRWAQGGQEVMFRHFNIFTSWKRRRLYPVFTEQLLSLIWVLCWLLLTMTEIFYLFYNSDSYIPYLWKSQFLSVVCMTQFIVALNLERRYDKTIFKYMVSAAWYPVVYWIINGVVSLSAFPKTVYSVLRKKKLATWSSPDRGIGTSSGKKNKEEIVEEDDETYDTASHDREENEFAFFAPDLEEEEEVKAYTGLASLQTTREKNGEDAHLNGQYYRPEEKKKEDIIKNRQRWWKKIIEIFITVFAWAFILIYIFYIIYGAFSISVGKTPFAFFIYNEAMVLESRHLAMIAIIILLVEIVLMIFWKEYNRIRFGRKDRRKFRPDVSVEEIAEIMHTTPENIREIQQKKVIVFEKNVVPEELH